jgi:colanic acid biosynthesis glycosyl transferase WcaI
LKLLVITNLYFPDRGGGASVFADLTFGLVERGIDVTVFTTFPYYPEWRHKSAEDGFRIAQEEMNGVKILRHKIFVPKNPSRLLPRVAYEASFGLTLMRSLFRGPRYDAVMVYCPMLGAVGFAALRTAIRREKLWLNIQDVPADAAMATGVSRSKAFGMFAQRLQKFLFNRAKTWSTISPVMLERLLKIKSGEPSIHLCPNWLNGSLAERVAEMPRKVGRLPKNPVTLLYAGNIGAKQGLLEFCQILKKSPLNFLFKVHGNGGEAENVRQWIKSSMDARFTFGEFLDEAGFSRALHETDLFVITEKPDIGASFIPSKLIPCISTGTPILAVCDSHSPLGAELQEFNLGWLLEWPEVRENLVKSIADILANPERFKKVQEQCLSRAHVYNRGHAIDRFATLLRDFAGKNAPVRLEEKQDAVGV